MHKIKIPYCNTLLYIFLILLVNLAFSFAPIYHFWGGEVSPMDLFVGVIYIFRDFAQQELGHKKIFLAMLVGGLLSYYLADPAIALASILAFATGELIDWSVFTLTGQPLAVRLLWSASLSSPVDSIVFLAVIDRLNFLAVTALSLSKLLGVLTIWWIWRVKRRASL